MEREIHAERLAVPNLALEHHKSALVLESNAYTYETDEMSLQGDGY